MDAVSLREYVNASESQQEFVDQCWSEASVLVANAVGTYTVPQEVIDRATLEAGSELFHRRNAPNGIAQFSSYDGNPIRVARDPMVAAWPILSPWVVVGL